MIHSIEGLNRIRMPQIKVLDLGINRIVHFADLKKGYWANLVQLDLCNDLLTQMETKPYKLEPSHDWHPQK